MKDENEEIEFLGENLRENKKREKKEKPIKEIKPKRNGNSFILPIVLFFVGAALMYLLIYYVLPLGKPSTTINRSEKEVTIKEKTTSSNSLTLLFIEF